MSETHILWANNLRPHRLARLVKYLQSLADDKTWEITIKQQRKKRTESQNNYLWGCVYPTLLRQGGESLAGFTDKELHEYFLGVHFGNECRVINGRTHFKPKHRSHDLDTKEFIGFWETVHREAAMLGINIPDPDPAWFEKKQAA